MNVACQVYRSALAGVVLLVVARSASAADYVFSTGLFVPIVQGIPGGNAPNPLELGDVLHMNLGGDKTFSAITYTNLGEVDWNGNSVSLVNTAVINNRGLWDCRTNNLFTGTANSLFDNSGTLRKSGAVGNTTVDTVFTNTGTIDTQSGTLTFGAGDVNTVAFNDGSIFSGNGMTVISNGASFKGAITSSNLVLQLGRHVGDAVVLNGSAVFTGGIITGTWALASGQELKVQNGFSKALSGATFTNHGNVRMQTPNELDLFNGTLFDNQGLFDVQSTTVVFPGGAPLSTFANSGTFRVATGQSVSIGGIAFVNNAGVLQADAGGALNFGGGNALFNTGTQFLGAGVVAVAAPATFNGSFFSTNLSLRAGAMTGTSAVLNGTVEFSAGTLQGSWTIGAGATLNPAAGNSKFLTALTLTNQGTIAVPAGITLSTQNGTTISNQGTIALQGTFTYNGGAIGTFVNTGLVAATGPFGGIGGNLGFDNRGIVNVATGGTLSLPGDFTNNGTLQGTGTLSTNVLTNAGHVAPGGSPGTLTLNASYVQASTGVLDVEIGSSGTADSYIINGSAQLGGTLALTCTGGCLLRDGDTFVVLDSTGAETGTFASVTTTGFSPGFQYDLTYDRAANLVRLSVIRARGPAVPALDRRSQTALVASLVAVALWNLRRSRRRAHGWR